MSRLAGQGGEVNGAAQIFFGSCIKQGFAMGYEHLGTVPAAGLGSS